MATKPYWAKVSGPLAAYADGFRVDLESQGYTPLSAAMHLRLMAHLDRWMAREALTVSALTPPVVERYFAGRRAAGYHNERTAQALQPLLGHLLRLGVVAPAPPVVAATPVERLLAAYQDYLRTERGLAPATVALNTRLVHPFLLERAKTSADRLELQGMTAGEVAEFVVMLSRRRPRSVKRIVSALRSLLGFLYVTGVIGQQLGVPSAAGWRLAALPKALEADQVSALLTACDQRTATGRRDLAILTLLVRLGLRAGEVAGLRFEDIDWRRGEITVRGKGNRHDRLPLPADAGERIVAYLQAGRPAYAQGRTVFVGAQAPHRPLTTAAVTTIVAVAGRRAGIGPIHAHRLRHSAAVAMLRGGGSLGEIGQVLRHARPLASAIYAKVDRESLRQLARPWPGAA